MSKRVILSRTVKWMFHSIEWRLMNLEAHRQNTEQNARDYQICHQRLAELAERVAVLEHRLREQK